MFPPKFVPRDRNNSFLKSGLSRLCSPRTKGKMQQNSIQSTTSFHSSFIHSNFHWTQEILTALSAVLVDTLYGHRRQIPNEREVYKRM